MKMGKKTIYKTGGEAIHLLLKKVRPQQTCALITLFNFKNKKIILTKFSN
jgi:hypothetical protein